MFIRCFLLCKRLKVMKGKLYMYTVRRCKRKWKSRLKPGVIIDDSAEKIMVRRSMMRMMPMMLKMMMTMKITSC